MRDLRAECLPSFHLSDASLLSSSELQVAPHLLSQYLLGAGTVLQKSVVQTCYSILQRRTIWKNNVASKRISEKMEKALNDQMTSEAFQAQVYLSYASWAEVSGYPGIAEFLYKHMNEERKHMFKFLKYINNRGGEAKIQAIGAPPPNPKGVKDCLEKTLQHEIDNSMAIDKIVSLALEERDWATFNFGQWFVQEQIEEETLIKQLLDKYFLSAGRPNDDSNLYELDKDLATASQEVTIPSHEEL